MKTLNYNIHILMGLPGSGKSYFVSSKLTGLGYDELRKHWRIDVDEYIKQANNKISGAINKAFGYGHPDLYKVKDIYVDGLFLTNDQLSELIYSIFDNLSNYWDQDYQDITYKANIIIHYWKENREACIKNDASRLRTKNSKSLIENSPFEYPDLERLNKVFGESSHLENFIWIEEHDVYEFDNIIDHLISEKKKYSQRYKGRNSDKHDHLYSEIWRIGGRWGDCWGNEGELSGEPPCEFTEFDALIESLCPNIPFMQYKQIYNSCVTTDTYTEYGYYGGYDQYCRYICDLNKLKNELTERGLI